MKTKGAFYAQWGLILGGGTVAIKWVIQFISTGEASTNLLFLTLLLPLVYYTVFASILFVTIRKYKRNYLGEYPEFGQLFRCGFGSTLYASIIVGILMFVYFGYVIDEHRLYTVQEMAYNTMAPMITSENEEVVERSIKLMIDPYYLGSVDAIGFIFEGAFITLIISLSMRRKNPNPFAEIE